METGFYGGGHIRESGQSLCRTAFKQEAKQKLNELEGTHCDA